MFDSDVSVPSNNGFNMSYYCSIIDHALRSGYKFVTLSEFIDLGCPDKKHFIIRHDVDRLPSSLIPVVDVELTRHVKSTVFVRVAGAEYNPLGYSALRAFRYAADSGCEIGLHTNFVEFSIINELPPHDVLKAELATLRGAFDVVGIAPHRDINYQYNSLPMLQQFWEQLSATFGLKYHAYEDRILSATNYVNEGLNPHLCWRKLTPHEAIDNYDGRSICLLTHPHWWFFVHPFEAM